jgi:hypothetical protein
MSLLSQFSDTAAYHLHNLTYNPDAEKFAKEKQEKLDAIQQGKLDAIQKQKDDEKAAKENALSKKQKEIEKDIQDNNKFSIYRFLYKILGTVGIILLVFIVVIGGVFGASLATNLNVYRPMGFRILYALYGFFFFWIVIPYAVLWRWIWKGKKPRFYALIPIIPYYIENRFLAMFFSWLSFKPDDQIEALREWHTHV